MKVYIQSLALAVCGVQFCFLSLTLARIDVLDFFSGDFIEIKKVNQLRWKLDS